MQDLIKRLLAEIGEDPAREGLVNTPKRVEQALKFLTSGYEADVDTVINNALFTVDYSEMVIVKDIDFYSLCEHHLLPFFGKCHVAYIPNDEGDRTEQDSAARRHLQPPPAGAGAAHEPDRRHHPRKGRPSGVAVVMEGTHLCMSMRGVQKQNSFAVTSAMHGIFRDKARTRMEFLELIRLRSGIPGSSSAAESRLRRRDELKVRHCPYYTERYARRSSPWGSSPSWRSPSSRRRVRPPKACRRRPPPALTKVAPEMVCPTPLGIGVSTQSSVLRRDDGPRSCGRAS